MRSCCVCLCVFSYVSFEPSQQLRGKRGRQRGPWRGTVLITAWPQFQSQLFSFTFSCHIMLYSISGDNFICETAHIHTICLLVLSLFLSPFVIRYFLSADDDSIVASEWMTTMNKMAFSIGQWQFRLWMLLAGAEKCHFFDVSWDFVSFGPAHGGAAVIIILFEMSRTYATFDQRLTIYQIRPRVIAIVNVKRVVNVVSPGNILITLKCADFVSVNRAHPKWIFITFCCCRTEWNTSLSTAT